MPIIVDPNTGQRKFVIDNSGVLPSPVLPRNVNNFLPNTPVLPRNVNNLLPNTPAPTQAGEFKKGLRSGVEQVKGLGSSAVAAGAALVGADDFSEEQTQQANRRFQRAGEIGPRVTDFDTATESFENFTDFLKGGVGQAVPTMAAAAVGGLGGLGVKSLLKSGISKTAAGGAGAFAATEGMEAGGIFNEVVNDPEARKNHTLSELAGISFAGGAPAAALDTLPLMIAARRFGLGLSARKEITSKLKELGKGMGTQALIEGSTEGAQTVIERATHNFVNKNFEILGPEGVNEILGATTIGTAFGGIVGGASIAPGIIGSRMAELDQQQSDGVLQAEATFDKLRRIDDDDVQQYLDGVQDSDLADTEVQDDLDSVLKELNLRRPKFSRNVSNNSRVQAAEEQLSDLRAIRDKRFLTPDGKGLINTPEALAFQKYLDSQTRNFMNLRQRVSDTRDGKVESNKFQRTAKANRAVKETSKRIGALPRDAAINEPVTKPYKGPELPKVESKETPISRRKKPPIVDKTADIKAGIESLGVPEKTRVGKLTAGNIKKDAIYGREIDEQTAQDLAAVFNNPLISDSNKRTLAEEYLTHPEFAFGEFDKAAPQEISEADALDNDLAIKNQAFAATTDNILGDKKSNVTFSTGGPINEKTGKPKTATDWALERKAVLEADNPGFSFKVVDAFEAFAEQANSAFFARELSTSRGDEIIRLAQDDNLRMRTLSQSKQLDPSAIDTVQKVEQHLKGRKLLLREKIESALDPTDKQALTGTNIKNELPTFRREARARARADISTRKEAALGDPASVHSQTQAELTQVEKIWEQVKDKDSNPLSSQGAVDIAIELEVKSTDNRKTNQRLVREAVEAKLFSVQQAMKTTEVAIAETQGKLLEKDLKEAQKNTIVRTRKHPLFSEKGKAWFDKALKKKQPLKEEDYKNLRSVDRSSRMMLFGRESTKLEDGTIVLGDLVAIRPHAMIQQNFQKIFGGQGRKYDRTTINEAYLMGLGDLIRDHGIIIDKASLTEDVILFTDASKHPWTVGEVGAQTERDALTKAKSGVEILLAREQADEKANFDKINRLKVRLLEITRSQEYADFAERKAIIEVKKFTKVSAQLKRLAEEKVALDNIARSKKANLSKLLSDETLFSDNLISVMNNAPTSKSIKPTKVSVGPMFDALPAYTGDTNTYAGVGSRQTPIGIRQVMGRVALILGKNGKHLNTGNAQGADAAFVAGARGRSTIFYPKDATDRTRAIAKEIHPRGDKLQGIGLQLHARNTNQIFGKNLDTPVDFLLAWTPNGETQADQRYYGGKEDPDNTGGTGTAIALADYKSIPVINLKNKGWLAELGKVAGLSKTQLDFIRGPIKPAQTAKVQIVDGTAATKAAARAGKGVYVMRPNANDKLPGVDEKNHFGNPFSHAGYQGTIKVKDIPTAVKNYRDWLDGSDFQDVQPERRQWMLDQIDAGIFDNKTMLYFKGGYRSHADELADFVGQRIPEIRDTAPASKTASGTLLGDDYIHQSIHKEVLGTHIEAENKQVQWGLRNAQEMEVGKLQSIHNRAGMFNEDEFSPMEIGEFTELVTENQKSNSNQIRVSEKLLTKLYDGGEKFKFIIEITKGDSTIGMPAAEAMHDQAIAQQKSLLDEAIADKQILDSMVSQYTKESTRLLEQSKKRLSDINTQIKQHETFLEKHAATFERQNKVIQEYASFAASIQAKNEEISTKNTSYDFALRAVRALEKAEKSDISVTNILNDISPTLIRKKDLEAMGLTPKEYQGRFKNIDSSALINEVVVDPTEFEVTQKSANEELVGFDKEKTSGFANAAEASARSRLQSEITELEDALAEEDLRPTKTTAPYAKEDFADTALANQLKAKKLELQSFYVGRESEPKGSVLDEQTNKHEGQKGQGGQGPNAQRNVLGKLDLALDRKLLDFVQDILTPQELVILETQYTAQKLGLFMKDLKGAANDTVRNLVMRRVKKDIATQVNQKLKPIVAAVKQVAGRIKSSAEVLSTEQAMEAFNMTRQQLLETNGMYFKGKIWVKENLSPAVMREVIAHELGHGIFENELRTASTQIRTDIRKQFDAWRKAIHGKSVHSVIQSKAAFNTAYKYITESTDRAVSSLSSEDQTYLLDFEEWFADQVAVWESTKPKTVLQKFFKKISDLIKKIMGRQTTDSVRDFLDGIEQRNWIPSVISRGKRFFEYARASKQITDDTLMSHLIKSAPRSMADIETLSNMLPSIFTKADLNLLGRAFTQGNVRSQLFYLYPTKALEAFDNSVSRTVAAGLIQWAHGKLQVGPKVHSVYEKAMGKLATALKGKTDMQKQNAALDAIKEGKAIWGHRTDLALTTERTDAKRFKDAESIADFMTSIGSVFEKVFISANDRLYGTKNPALIRLAQMFHSRTGTRMTKQGYFQEKQRNVGRYLSSATNVLKPLSDEQKTQVLEDLRTGKHTSNEAAGMRKIFNAMYAYANNNGVEVKLRKNYVPRVWNKEEVANRRSELEALLDQHGIKDSEKAVDRLLGLEDREIEEWLIPYEPALGAAKERGLGEVPDTVLGEAGFLSNDLEYITVNYIESLVKRVEYAKRFGENNEKIIEITKDAQRLGATEGDIELMHSYIQAMMGITGHETNQALARMLGLKAPPPEQKINPAVQQVLSTVLVIRNLALLSLAMFTSLADPLGISVRSGSLTDTGVALKTGMSEIWNSVTGQQSQVHELANALGILESHMTNVALQWEYGGTYMAPWARNVNDSFFKWTGLTGLTRLTRSMALGASHSFIARHASNPNESSRRYLEELNLIPEEVMLTPDGKSVRILTFQERSQAQQHERDRDDKVRAAMNQFVDEAILRPNAAQRPIWASDPHYMLVFHLKAFMYSFHDRILRRAVTEMGEHNSVAPMVGLMMFIPALLFIDGLRDLIKHGGTPAYKQNWDMTDYTFNAMERSGLFGIYQQGLDIRQSQQYGGTGAEALLGGVMFPFQLFTDPAEILPFQNLRTQ